MPRYLPVGVSSGGRRHVHLGGQRGGEVGVAHPGERVRDGRVGPQHDRLGRHQPARGALLVRHQPPYVRRVVRAHQRQQPLLVLLGQLAEQVGRVVGVHGLQDVRGALLLELAEDLDLVVLRKLLQDVGEPVVVQGRGDLGAPLRGQVVQDVREVGGAQLFEGGEQVLGALPVLLQREPGDGRPLDGQGLALGPPERAARSPLPYEDPVDLPVAARGQLLDGDVQDGDRLGRFAGLREGDAPVEEFAEDEPFGGALLETADVQHAGRDDLARLDARHPGHGQEDTAPGGQFDDEAEQSRGPPSYAQHGDEVAHASHLVAVGVEDGDAGEVGDKDPGGACGHPGRLLLLTGFGSGVMECHVRSGGLQASPSRSDTPW